MKFFKYDEHPKTRAVRSVFHISYSNANSTILEIETYGSRNVFKRETIQLFFFYFFALNSMLSNKYTTKKKKKRAKHYPKRVDMENKGKMNHI